MSFPPNLLTAPGKRTLHLRVCVAAAVGAAALTVSACGSSTPKPTPTLDAAKIAGAIQQTILSQRGISTTVACPTGQPRKTGYSFVCSAKLAVGSYPVRVIETNARGGVRYANSAPLRALDSHRIERAIVAAILKQRHLRATVVCPSPILQQSGLNFTCTATTRRGRGPFAVTETDAAGHVKFVGR